MACCMNNRPRLELSGQERVFSVVALSHEAKGFAHQPVVFEAKPMTQDFTFAQDVILDPDTGKIFAVVRNGGSGATGLGSRSSLARKCTI
jgi:hypothetical protein